MFLFLYRFGGGGILEDDAEHMHAWTGRGQCYCVSAQAFGVGALEDEDEDVYSTDAMSNYDQTMELDDSEQLFGWTAPGARKGKKGLFVCFVLFMCVFSLFIVCF